MSNKSSPPGPAMPRGFDSAAGLMQHNVEMATHMVSPFLAANISLLHWNAAHCKRMAQAYSQWFDFVGHRLEADAAFTEKLQATKDPEKISKACATFLETAAEDYQQEVAELTKMTNRMADEAADSLQDMSVSKQNGGGAVLGE